MPSRLKRHFAQVALSRAKEGLYILGNRSQFSSRSPMWKSVVDQLESQGCVGTAFPVACHRHPETIKHISKPGILPMVSPDGSSFFFVRWLTFSVINYVFTPGGCLQPCDARLKCGHVCPYKVGLSPSGLFSVMFLTQF